MDVGQLNEIHIYPRKGEPGQDLSDCAVEPDGLAGDRRKSAPVQVIAAQDVRPDTRANLVVSMGAADLIASAGSLLRIGDVELEVTGPAGSCPGVYAAVRRPGRVRVGDDVGIAEQPA